MALSHQKHIYLIEDTIYTATFYDDGIEENVCIGDIDKPVKYYFKLDDGFDSIYGLKEEVHDEGHRPYPLGGRMRYSVTAWAKLPEPYHKRTRKECPIKDIPGFTGTSFRPFRFPLQLPHYRRRLRLS